MINRNTKTELNTDIEFINEILNHIEEKDYDSAKTCLTDWQLELKNLIKQTNIDYLDKSIV